MVRNSKIVIRSQTSREKDKKVVTEGLKMTFEQTVTNASFH